MRDKKIISILCAALIALTVASGELPRLMSGSAFISAEENAVIGESGEDFDSFSNTDEEQAGEEELEAIAYSAQETYTSGDYEYTVADGKATITGYNGNAYILEIPSVIEGYTVTEIGNFAFEGCANLTSIDIPDSVTSLGDGAFYDCTGLTDITIPDSVTEIGRNAFGYCTSLISVTIPDSVTEIRGGAFYYCTSLTSITIPDSVTSIGNVAFCHCTSLTDITIPDRVTSIGDDVFYDCASLVSINVEEDNCAYSSNNGVLFNKDTTELICFPSCNIQTSYTIPNGVKTLKEGSFRSCTNLYSLIMPNSVTSIEKACFADCSNLSSIVISNNITSIEDETFNCCNNLIAITIPDGVTYIGDDAFSGCHKLESVIMPNSLTYIGDYAFYWCFPLKSIIIPNGVTHIGKWAFTACGLSTVTLSNSIKSIGYNAFGFSGDIEDVFFYGTKEQWEEIEIDSSNGNLTHSNIHFVDINDEEIKSELTATYITDNTQADITNISMYKGGEGLCFKIPSFLKLNDEKVYHGEILLRDYKADEVIFNIIDYSNSTVGEYWFLNNEDEIEICIPTINDASFHLRPNTSYYFDLSEVLINGQPYPDDDETKKQYCFTTGWGIVVGEQTFKFTNHSEYFIAAQEKDGYHITAQLYENEIKPYPFFREATVKQWLAKDKWDGSCFGMSAAMILTNMQRIEKDIPYNWDIPKDTAHLPYGSRDIINYYHIIQDWYDMKGGSNDAINIAEIFLDALKINNANDIFEMSYHYYYTDDENKKQKAGHSVVVVGAERSDEGDFLYVYDPNHKIIDRWKIIVVKNQIKDFVFIEPKLSSPFNAFGIHWMESSDWNQFTSQNIKNYTRLWAAASNRAITISNGANSTIINEDMTYDGTLTLKDVRYKIYDSDVTSDEMLIVLLPENYYEISTDDGVLDVNVANANMFYAIKSDNAEKTVVSAEDGVKLINAVGNYELTVSTENMPYNMFDVSGTANGDVICEYTDNGVEVNLDHTADTVITFYHDLETEDYIVPAEYDRFVVGELKSKEAIFVDTNNDGIFDTDIIGKTDDIHTHTFSTEWKSDSTSHWYECVCGEKSELTAHTENSGVITIVPTTEATGVKTYSCTVCGYTMRTEMVDKLEPEHNHSFSAEWKSDSASHWHECACGEKSDFSAHTLGEWIANAAAGYRHHDCTVCGAVLETESLTGGNPSIGRPVTSPTVSTGTTNTESTNDSTDPADTKDDDTEEPESDETDEKGDIDADMDENDDDDDENKEDEDNEDNESDDGYDDTFSKGDSDGNDAVEDSPIVTPEVITRDKNPNTGVPVNAAMIFGFLVAGAAAYIAFSKRENHVNQ